MVDNMIKFQFRRSLTNVTCITTKIFLPVQMLGAVPPPVEMWCSPWICIHVFLWFQTVLLLDFYNHKWLMIGNDEDIYTAAFKIYLKFSFTYFCFSLFLNHFHCWEPNTPPIFSAFFSSLFWLILFLSHVELSSCVFSYLVSQQILSTGSLSSHNRLIKCLSPFVLLWVLEGWVAYK